MDLDGPAGNSGNGGVRLPRGADCDASVELAAATAVRLAHTHLLASTRPVGALPDLVRWLGRLCRRKRACASSHERKSGGAYGGTHERAVGKDDARGTRKVPPGASWLLGRYASAGF